MWRKIIPLLLALSVGMNIAILAVWAMRSCSGCRIATCGTGQDCPGLHEYLRAGDTQQRMLTALMEQFHEKARPICGEIDARRAELIDLIAAEVPDSAAMAACQAAILAGQGRMQALVVEQLLAEKAVLTDDQRDALFDLLRSRPGCRIAGVGGAACAGTGAAACDSGHSGLMAVPGGTSCPGQIR